MANIISGIAVIGPLHATASAVPHPCASAGPSGAAQYQPTIVFLLGLFVFGEELRPAQLACYMLIWAAAALFTWELLRGRKAEVPVPA